MGSCGDFLRIRVEWIGCGLVVYLVELVFCAPNIVVVRFCGSGSKGVSESGRLRKFCCACLVVGARVGGCRGEEGYVLRRLRPGGRSRQERRLCSLFCFCFCYFCMVFFFRFADVIVV